MKKLFLYAALLFCYSCNNDNKTTSSEEIKDTLNTSETLVDSEVKSDTNWYTKVKPQYDAVCYDSVTDTFLKRILQPYFTLDDTIKFPKYFKEYKFTRKADSLLSFRSNKPIVSDYEVSIHLEPFDSTKYVITYTPDHAAYLLNNKVFWGTDGGLPFNTINKLAVLYENNIVEIPKSEYDNVFNLIFNGSVERIAAAVDKEKGYFMIIGLGSDGAGSYTVVWIFKDGKYIRRVIESMC